MKFLTAINEKNEFVYVWQSRPQAAKDLEVSVTSISYALNGTFKTCKGYTIRELEIKSTDLAKIFNDKNWNISYCTDRVDKYIFA